MDPWGTPVVLLDRWEHVLVILMHCFLESKYDSIHDKAVAEKSSCESLDNKTLRLTVSKRLPEIQKDSTKYTTSVKLRFNLFYKVTKSHFH